MPTDYAQGRKALVIHEDDVGMTHGSNVAFGELSARGVISSGSAMVPCPWFAETLAMAAAEPSLDLGVHLTLNSEQRPVKWRPLTNPPKSAGLTDDNGYFWPDPALVRRHAEPEAVREASRTRHAMKRFGKPEEVARTALFLVSDESSYFTGEILHPAGGMFTG